MDFADIVELPGIGPLLKRATLRLSGGERQRVATARALLASPRLLSMDEPLSALEHAARQAILPYLKSLHDEFGLPLLQFHTTLAKLYDSGICWCCVNRTRSWLRGQSRT